MHVLVTGANGFIGKNLCLALERTSVYKVLRYGRCNANDLDNLVKKSDFIIHLAGENRPNDLGDFNKVNVGLTQKICDLVIKEGKRVPIVFSSSSQAILDNEYGKSKRAAEKVLEAVSENYLIPVRVFRLPGIFGKWAKPNYNSVVATFSNNIANNLPITVDDPDAEICLGYIDDLILDLLGLVKESFHGYKVVNLSKSYSVTLGHIVKCLNEFKRSRENLMLEPVGSGFLRALYATYLSYLPTSEFSYRIPCYSDNRGVFIEFLKTPTFGQFSSFTSLPGVIRGGHYHHTKVERFLVVKGSAIFRFNNILTGEITEFSSCANDGMVVETIPGWSHEVINSGNEEMVVLLWASEIFDRERPDTYSFED